MVFRAWAHRWTWLAVVGALGLTLVMGRWDSLAGEPKAAPTEKGSAKPGKKTEKPGDDNVDRDDENPFPRAKAKAPPLEGGVAWLNSAGPIDISKLKGKIILLDFWTYCCINCMHILPELAKLEEEFPNELVVIGVHSAKFEGERDSKNIREAILRYGIKHPVVNDAKMEIWRNYEVHAWPTQALVDPEGTYIGQMSGEGHYELFREAIRRLIKYHKKKGTLDTRPIHFELETLGSSDTPLRFPGKVAVDPVKNRLIISDSSHNRIVIAKLDTGEVTDVIGDGVPERKDGAFADARFHDPQGIAIAGDILYVADTKNHSIRKIDLERKTVASLAGTGIKGFERQRSGPGLSIEMASPWDVLLQGETLYIAMAGTHQIWTLNVKTGVVAPFAGSGRENIVDGALDEANFAQPSGLATDGIWLYVADSEVSAIRQVGLKEPIVKTVVGQGLFEFGDRDGVGPKVRLQHALGVATHGGLLYVADTYNNKIKQIDPKTTETKTFLGEKKAGAGDDPPHFDEPGGLTIVNGTIYVADTNNHAIRKIDIKTKKTETVVLKSLTPPKRSDEIREATDAKVVRVAGVKLKPAGPWEFVGAVTVPADHKLNPDAPMSYRIEKSVAGKWQPLAKGRIGKVASDFQVTLAAADLAGADLLRLAVTFYPCQTGSEGVCRVATQVWEIPTQLDAAGVSRVELK